MDYNFKPRLNLVCLKIFLEIMILTVEVVATPPLIKYNNIREFCIHLLVWHFMLLKLKYYYFDIHFVCVDFLLKEWEWKA